MPRFVRVFAVLLASVLLVPSDSSAFSSPLSDEAVRDAYFLGQRRDETTARFLAKYKQHLPAPEAGPYVASVEMLTPFALEVLQSSEQTMGYSAQQAAAAHRGKEERVVLSVEILLTDSYGPLIVRPVGARSGSPVAYAFRSADFWKQIEVQVAVDDKIVKPARFQGEPTYLCSDGGCQLTGAILRLEFEAAPFDSNTATVEMYPPEGREVVVDFDLTALR